ncbi:MAG: hypothetical protein AB1641_08005 [Thermodesulfobacteriota bacterium]
MSTSLRDILNLLFRYINILLSFTLIVLFLIAIYYLGSTRSYDSKAKVLIRLGVEQMGGAQFVSRQSNVYVTRREQELTNEMEILNSEKVMEAAAKAIIGPKDQARLKNEGAERIIEIALGQEPGKYHHPTNPVSQVLGGTYDFLLRYWQRFLDLILGGGEQADPIVVIKKRLKDGLKVKAVYSSDTLEATFSFPNPLVSQMVLDIILSEYTEAHINAFKSSKELKFLEKEVSEARTGYQGLLARFSDFMKQQKIYDDDKQLYFLLEERNRLRQELDRVEAEHAYHLNRLTRLTQIKTTLKPMVTYASVRGRNKRLDQMKSNLVSMEREKQSLLNRYTADSRIVKEHEREMELLRRFIEESPEQVLDSRDDRKNPTFQLVEEEIVRSEADVEAEKAKIASLKKAMDGKDAELERYSQEVKDYTSIKRELNLAQKNYERIFEGFVDSRLKSLVEINQITNVSVIESPSLDMAPAKPKRVRLILLALGLFVFGNLALLAFLTAFDSTVTNPSQITRILGLPVVCVFPWLRPISRRESTGFLWFYENQIRELQRWAINLTGREERLKGSFLIGKSQTGEGGTTMCLNLAAFLAAHQHQRVAVINYDQEKKLSLEAGLFQVGGLGGEAFRQVALEGFTLFQYESPAGGPKWDDEKKYGLVGELESKYDVVLINTPPVSSLPDLFYLHRRVKKTVLVLMAESTKIQVVKYNTDILDEYGFKEKIAILNKRRHYIPKFIYSRI